MIRRFIRWLTGRMDKSGNPPPSRATEEMCSTEAAVIHYFEHSSATVFTLAYSPLYQDAVSALRIKGWKISLAISATGELQYLIHKKAPDWLTNDNSTKKFM